MTKKKVFLLLVFFYITLYFFVVQISFSQENQTNSVQKKYTNHQINFGLSFNRNFYLSDFNELTGIYSCVSCDLISFEFGKGFGYSFWLGYGKNLPNFLFNKDFLFNANVKFSNHSGKFSEKVKIGNKIYDDYYEDLISEHSLDVDLYSILLTPSISMHLLDKNKLPLSINFGLNLGFLMNGNFTQKEELVSPKDEFFQNGNKINNLASGNLPNQSIFFAGISLGIAYDLWNFSDFVLSPNLNFNYGFTNLISDLNWKTHSANLGINIAYKIPKKVEKTPETPIIQELPVIPEPPKIPEIKELDLIVDASQENNTTIKVPIYIDKFINISSNLPIIYFEQNSGKIIEGYPKNLISSLKNENLKIEIGISSSENESVFNLRKKEILNFLLANQIDTNSIIFEKNHKIIKEKYSEIEKESSYAKFFINNKLEQLLTEDYNIIINKVDNKNINFTAKIVADSLPYSCQFNYKIKQNNQIISEKTIENEEKIELKIDDNLLNWKNEFAKNEFKTNYNIEKSEIEIQCKVVDAEEKSKIENFKYEIEPQFFVTNFHNSKAENFYNSEFILGYFSFDEAEIFAVNEKVLSEIKKLLSENKKIEVFATTDNFGTQNYNSDLSQKRAKAAIEIIDSENKYSQNISIGSKNEIKINFDNSTTYDRQKNRVAIVRILK